MVPDPSPAVMAWGRATTAAHRARLDAARCEAMRRSLRWGVTACPACRAAVAVAVAAERAAAAVCLTPPPPPS